MIHSGFGAIYRITLPYLRILHTKKLHLYNRYRVGISMYPSSQNLPKYSFLQAPRATQYGKGYLSSKCLCRFPSRPLLWRGWTPFVCSTQSRRAFSIMAWLVLKSILKIVSIVVGRQIRQKYWALSRAERQIVRNAIQKNIHIPSAIFGALFILSCVYYTNHIEAAPVTGRKRFISFTNTQANEIAVFQADFLVTFFKDRLVSAEDPQLQRVAKIARKIIETNSEVKKVLKTWNIYMVKDSNVNAFVLPTGHMFVFQGILDICSTDDQLAIILGHEIAHTVLQHHLEVLSRGSYLDWFLIIAFAFIWCFLRSDFLAIVSTFAFSAAVKLVAFLPASRRQEWEADHVGLVFAAQACYDVREAGILWKKIAKHQESTSVGLLPIWMGTHPDSIKRAEYLDSLLKDAEGWRKANGCPPLINQKKP